MREPVASIALALNSMEGDGGRQWVQLLPAGPDVVGRDGRSWKMADPGAVVGATLALNRPLAVDWEHSSEYLAPKGHEAPASGWIEGLDVRQGAVWGKIDWTPGARNQVASREYRFISPTFVFDAISKQIKRPTGAGLTNNPNLEMVALARAEPKGWVLDKEPVPYPEDITRIATALGLTEDQVMSDGAR